MTSSNPAAVAKAIFAGCVVAFLGFGFAAAFGVFLQPISDELGWGRQVFSLSVALQMLFWGLTQPFAGAVADRSGTARVLAVGCVFAAAGFALRAAVPDSTVFAVAGVLVGIGTGACSFTIVIVALGKVVPEARRSLIMGLGTAAASLGMFVGAPASVQLIDWLGWRDAILAIAASYLAILPFLVCIARVSEPTAAGSGLAGFRSAVGSAFRDRSYVCLFVGFFVCGFHVAFIQTHLPAYLTDLGLAAGLGAVALALIGLLNIAGSFLSGWSGQVMSKKKVLAGIYFARSVVIAAFILVPLSPTSVAVFAAAIGLLWLSTVPLTTGLVAQTQGLTYLSTLAGLVFLSHQVGSFLGAWMGGWIYDLTRDYSLVWWTAVALGLFAAIVHLPIREQVPQPAAAE